MHLFSVILYFHLPLLFQLLAHFPYACAFDETLAKSRKASNGWEFAAPFNLTSSSRSPLWNKPFMGTGWTLPGGTNESDTIAKRQSCAAGNSPCGIGCCPSSEACCTTGCCNAGEKCATLVGGATGCCPNSAVQCSSGGCCPPSQKCCDHGGCCPSSQQCCGVGHCALSTSTCCSTYQCSLGKSCCGSNGCYDPSTEQCCSTGGACLKSETCCGEVCCKEGAVCKSGSCYIQTPLTPTAAPPVPTATPKTTITLQYYPNKMVKNTSGKRIPADNKGILKNMCEGIKKFLGYAAQEIQLTKEKASQQTNRAIMCPPGFCADAIKEYAEEYPDVDPADLVVASGMSCDEFPFAISKQGGNLTTGTRICVEGWENSWQGGTMSRKISQLVDGEDFLVKIVGWDCKMQIPIPVIEEVSVEKGEDVSDSDDLTEDDLYYNFDDSDNALIMSLGDLDAGHYTYSLRLTSGTIASAFVTDYIGNQYYTSSSSIHSSSNTVNISFILSTPAYGVGLVAVQDPNDSNITLGYTAEKTANITDFTTSVNGAVGMVGRVNVWSTVALMLFANSLGLFGL